MFSRLFCVRTTFGFDPETNDITHVCAALTASTHTTCEVAQIKTHGVMAKIASLDLRRGGASTRAQAPASM